MGGVSRENTWNNEVNVGIARIAVPFGVDRDRYVESCYRKERVCVIVDNGGTLVKDCYIDSSILQSIKFPPSYRELGSRVVFVMNSKNPVPIIVANISKSFDRNISREESFSIYREYKGGVLSIVGSGEGKLYINLSNIDGADVKISSRGVGSSIELNSDGIVTLNSEDDITANSSKKVVHNVLNDVGDIEKSLEVSENGLRYWDDKDSKFEISYEEGKIKHHEGSEPIPLGDTLKSELNKLNSKFNTLVDILANTVVVPSDGGAALQTAIKLTVQPLSDADFDDINSEKSFID